MLSLLASAPVLIASFGVRDALSIAKKWSPVATTFEGTVTFGVSDVERYTQFVTRSYLDDGALGLVHTSGNSLSVFLVCSRSFVASLTTCEDAEFDDVARQVVDWYRAVDGNVVSVEDEHMRGV